MTNSKPDSPNGAMAKPAKGGPGRWLPLIVLGLGFVGFLVVDRFFLNISQYLSFESLRDNQAVLKQWVADNGVLSAATFIALYIVVVAFSLPGGALLSIVGGFLFGWLMGGIFIVAGATVGATLVFLAARTALGDLLRKRAGATIQRMEAGFRENAFNYLLVLRLVPLFPFFVVNIVPAFLGVSLPTYFWATAIGIIPGTFVYASVGNGLGAVFERGDVPDLGIIFEPAILGPLVGLAVLALIPVVYQKVRGRTSPAKNDTV